MIDDTTTNGPTGPSGSPDDADSSFDANSTSNESSAGFRMPDPEADFAGWPEPEPLNNGLYPVPSLSEEIIPPPLRGWVQDVAYRMQVPLCFTAAAALVVAGSLIGTGCGIKPKARDDWLVLPNLWGGLVSLPGRLKSPALAAITDPLIWLESEEKSLHDYQMELYRVDKAEYDSRRKVLEELMKAAAKKEESGR
jgi:hypothetical protein